METDSSVPSEINVSVFRIIFACGKRIQVEKFLLSFALSFGNLVGRGGKAFSKSSRRGMSRERSTSYVSSNKRGEGGKIATKEGKGGANRARETGHHPLAVGGWRW